MEILPSQKKLIIELGLVVGAGIALTFLYRSISKKGRILHSTKIDAEGASAAFGNSRNPVSIHVLKFGTIRHHDQAARSPSVSGESSASRAAAQAKPAQEVPPTCDYRVGIAHASLDESDAPPRGVSIPPALRAKEEPSVHRAAAVWSIGQRFGAAVLDAFVILFACCLFVAISQAFRMSVRIGRFDLVILTCSVVLIAGFYAFLCKLGGHGTAGQTWIKLGLNAALERRSMPQDHREALTQPGNNIGGSALITAASMRKSSVPREYAGAVLTRI